MTAACSALLVAAVSLGFSSPSATGQDGDRDGSAQTVTAVGLDARVRGNSAESLGIIDPCTAVSVGDIFPMDVFVDNVNDLLAWEVYVQYDRSYLEILDRDVALFLESATNSNVVNVSDPLPSHSGLYRLAAADIATPAALESGSGVLARLTFQAKTRGSTPVSLAYLDYDDDGVYDVGPRLIGPMGNEMGDTDGDGFFDGTVNSSRVVVGSSCAASVSVAEPTPAASTGATTAPSPDVELSPNSTQAEPTPASDDRVEVPATPGADRTPANVGLNQGSGGDSSLLPWIMAVVGALGVVGLLFTLVALRQTRRDV